MIKLTPLSFYRIIAITIVLMPIALNLLYIGEIITSLLYVPIWLIVASSIFIIIDNKVINMLKKTQQKVAFKNSSYLAEHSIINTQKSVNTL